MQSISPQELFDLLNSKDHAGVVDRKDEPIFTKEELDMLLDRSDLTWKKISEKQTEEETEMKKKCSVKSVPVRSGNRSEIDQKSSGNRPEVGDHFLCP